MTAAIIVRCLLEDMEAQLPRLTREFPDFSLQQLQQIGRADPTDGGYMRWIVPKISQGQLKVPEDLPKVKELLSTFQRLKQSPQFKGDRNIFNYDSYADLGPCCGRRRQHVESAPKDSKIGRTARSSTSRKSDVIPCKHTGSCKLDLFW